MMDPLCALIKESRRFFYSRLQSPLLQDSTSVSVDHPDHDTLRLYETVDLHLLLLPRKTPGPWACDAMPDVRFLKDVANAQPPQFMHIDDVSLCNRKSFKSGLLTSATFDY